MNISDTQISSLYRKRERRSEIPTKVNQSLDDYGVRRNPINLKSDKLKVTLETMFGS